jgi:hypothetical protein
MDSIEARLDAVVQRIRDKNDTANDAKALAGKFPSEGTEQLASGFANAMITHHAADLVSPDEKVRDAVIVKMVALTALAFGIAPTDDGMLDVDDAMGRLRIALMALDSSHR